MIQGIAGAGIGLLVGLLARPFLEAYVAHRHMRDAVVGDTTPDTSTVVKSR